MTARKKPPQKGPNDNVVTVDELHKRRVQKLIKNGVADMKSGKKPFFPMHQLIKAESDRIQLEIDEFKKEESKKRNLKKGQIPKRH